MFTDTYGLLRFGLRAGCTARLPIRDSCTINGSVGYTHIGDGSTYDSITVYGVYFLYVTDTCLELLCRIILLCAFWCTCIRICSIAFSAWIRIRHNRHIHVVV